MAEHVIPPTYNQEVCDIAQITVPFFRKQYSSLVDQEKSTDHVCVAGRVRGRRDYGNLIFLDIQDCCATGQLDQLTKDNHLQLLISKKQVLIREHHNDLTFKQIYHNVKNTGDIVRAWGQPTRTKTGELTLQVCHFQILTPCVAPHGIHDQLADVQQQDARRSLHYLVNQDARLPILLRARLLRCLRKYLDDHGFHEVDTGVLCDNVGANAKPFRTMFNELDREVSLRVAPELALKRLVIGDLGPVYEIGPQFRNEGRDAEHNPEFTTCEFYLPYADLERLMNMTEELLNGLHQVTGAVGYPIPDAIKDISWEAPFRRIDITRELQRLYGEPVPVEREALMEFYARHGETLPEVTTATKMYDKLIERRLEPQCRQPTFLYGHPAMMSPLAQSKDGISQRFELFVGTVGRKTMELCNAYCELRDPELQKAAFQEQQANKAAGDDEVIEGDAEYCEALKLGLHPTGGWGMGIERLVMLMAGVDSIRKVRTMHLSNA